MPSDYRELQEKCDTQVRILDAQEEAKRQMEIAAAIAAAAAATPEVSD